MWMGAWEDGSRWGGSVGGWHIWERIAASSLCGPRSTPSHPHPLMRACCVCARVSRRCAQTDTCNAHWVERQQVHWPHIESSPFTVCQHVKGTRDVLGGQDVRGQGPWHVGDARDVFVVVAARHALRRGGARREGAGHVREVMAGAGAREGRAGRIWDGGGASRRGGVHRNASGCIERGRGVCVRSWLGLGHMKGMRDASGMASAR